MDTNRDPSKLKSLPGGGANGNLDRATPMDTDNRIAEAYGLVALPYWLAVSHEGRIVRRVSASLEGGGLPALARLAGQTVTQLKPAAQSG